MYIDRILTHKNLSEDFLELLYLRLNYQIKGKYDKVSKVNEVEKIAAGEDFPH